MDPVGKAGVKNPEKYFFKFCNFIPVHTIYIPMEVKEYNNCVHQWSDALFRFGAKCTGNKDDAHDVVQNSFEVLWQKRKDIPAEKAKAFLFQVAYRVSVDNYRKK
jgi:DNA-directed RNA polymerase specialized sigma24 family protein